MASDPLELIARLLGIESDELRRLATDAAGEPDQEPLSSSLGIDLALLSDLQDLSDRDDVEWDAVFDVDIDFTDDATKSPRRSRRGIGIRPSRRRSVAEQPRSEDRERERWSCPVCNRNFLSHEALQDHYDANPEHSRATLDVRDVEPDQNDSGRVDTEWIEFDDRVETFLALPEGTDETDLRVAHQQSDERVEISGSYEGTIDTSNITDIITDDVSWRISGRYLIVSFPTGENGSSAAAEDT